MGTNPPLLRKEGPGLHARSLTNIGILMSKCFGEGMGGWTSILKFDWIFKFDSQQIE
jgi:hypothetical protein